MSDHSTQSDDSELSATEQRKAVRERYAGIATDTGPCCGETEPAGGDTARESSECNTHTQQLGYTQEQAESVGAELSLGCGNPTAIASLEAGETVLDLGSGGGFDCFLAAREVGDTGRVIGVDMTPKMVETARENAAESDESNVEFRLGEIEHLPVADESVDVIISNCVVNLAPDKPQVFREAFRVLAPGGRLAISDVVLTAEPPAELKRDPASIAACVGGASPIPELETMLADAGFVNVTIAPKEESEEFISEWDDERDLSEYLVSATIEAEKPTQ